MTTNSMFNADEIRQSEINCTASDILATGCIKRDSQLQIEWRDEGWVILVDGKPRHCSSKDFDHVEKIVWILHYAIVR